MDVVYSKVLGIDVHQAILACCMVSCNESGELVTEKKTFKTYGQDLHELANWAKTANLDLVIMESTGIYWYTPYQVLEKVGIRAAVVNAREVRQMEGKKTDMGDAEWLAHIGRLGVFCRSFIPEKIYRELRIPSREIIKLTDDLSAEKNRFGKILNEQGFRLNVVFSDIFGVNATIVIDGLLSGKSIEEILNEINFNVLKKDPSEIKAAIESGTLNESACITLITIREHIQFLERQIENLRSYLHEKVEQLHPESLHFLQTIPGISLDSAVQLLVELGGDDMTPFVNAERLASWIGVCPGNNESAGKRKHGHIRKGNYYLRRILCECASAGVKTKGTTFQSKFRALRIRKNYKQALIAIVHKIVKVIFVMLKKRQCYIDPQIDYEKESADKNARRWIKLVCELPNWRIAARNLSNGERFASRNNA